MVGPHEGVGREGTAVVYGDWIFCFVFFPIQVQIQAGVQDS